MNDAKLQYFIVDAFTNQAFKGNPAAVVLLKGPCEDEMLRNIAMEMNLSETAFLLSHPIGYDLRWFTPKVEVNLCGHATLAAALVLSRLGELNDGSEVKFATRSGILLARCKGSCIELDFPLQQETTTQSPNGLLESLNVSARYVGKNQFDYLVEVQSEAILRSIKPDFKQLASVSCRGVIVTAPSADPQFDFASRFFAPAVGIDEDPVTGSAHCCLADFWGKRLRRAKMVGHQVSARGGSVHVEVRGDRVLLGGEAVIVAEGELLTG